MTMIVSSVLYLNVLSTLASLHLYYQPVSHTHPSTTTTTLPALPGGSSGSIKNQWQLWLYLSNSWLLCPPPPSRGSHFFLPSYSFPSSPLFICLCVCLSCVPRGRTRGRVVVDEEDSMDGTEVTESIGPQDTGETLSSSSFLIYYVRVGWFGLFALQIFG